MGPISILRAIGYHATTAFLFTKSDIKTTLIPVTVFALVSAPSVSLHRVPHIVFWIWLHLLQFDISNQTLKPEEDMHNKADRPLPSGRITLGQALMLRWLLVPLCFGLSLAYSVETLYASVALVALTAVYDEFEAHCSHWAVRNIVNGFGFASFECGATLVAGSDHTRLDRVGFYAVCLSAGIFMTTIHTQDFKDVVGDALVGRRTLPIVFPRHARKTVIVGLLAWSCALAYMWKLDAVTACVFAALGTLVGIRFLFYTSVPQDQVSFYLYNVWLVCAHALPGYWRYYL